MDAIPVAAIPAVARADLTDEQWAFGSRLFCPQGQKPLSIVL
jgi:hypothetical protein